MNESFDEVLAYLKRGRVEKVWFRVFLGNLFREKNRFVHKNNSSFQLFLKIQKKPLIIASLNGGTGRFLHSTPI